MITKQQAQSPKVRSIARAWIYAPVMATSFLALAQPTYADIDNSATASGTYGVTTITSPASVVNIPVVLANPQLSVAKSVFTAATTAAGNPAITDAGDTIVYQYIITNNGNVTITNVTPVDTGPLFGVASDAGTGSLSAFSPVPPTASLLPGQTATYTATYTLSTLDVDRAAGQPGATGVNNTATATGLDPTLALVTSPAGTAQTTIAAGPLLTGSKVGALVETNGNTSDGLAERNDVITYTYTVVNTGNVAITGIVINDTHEAPPVLPQASFTEGGLVDGPLAPFGTVSSDGPVDGSWDLLQPGATVTFTYVHTVTQTEIDGG